MSPETYEEQLSRVQLMASGDPTWDLSENDMAALNAVLDRLGAVESERDDWKRLYYGLKELYQIETSE